MPEVRREGIALADTRGDVTDLNMPEEGTAGHLTLLLAEWLAEQAQQARQETAMLVGLAAVRDKTAQLIEAYGKHWRKDTREPGAEIALAEQTLERLEALRLIRRTEDGVIVRPAIGRYALDAPRRAEHAEPTPALWEQSS